MFINIYRAIFLTCFIFHSNLPQAFFISSTLLWRHNSVQQKGKKLGKMLRLRISLIFCIIGTAASQAVGEDEQPFLRVIAPQFICNKKEIQPQNNNVTVGLQTREGQRLRYKISIDFEMIDGQFKSQQHTLSIWKNIRLLQKKFNDESEKISLKNQIEINSKEV